MAALSTPTGCGGGVQYAARSPARHLKPAKPAQPRRMLVEAVDFDSPPDSNRVIVSNLHPTTTAAELRAFLQKRCGLVHSIVVYGCGVAKKEPDAGTHACAGTSSDCDVEHNRLKRHARARSSESGYCLALFYSRYSSDLALKLSGAYINDWPVRVARCTRVMFARKPLTAPQCKDVMNYFLGFDGWSSAVAGLSRRPPEAEDVTPGADGAASDAPTRSGLGLAGNNRTTCTVNGTRARSSSRNAHARTRTRHATPTLVRYTAEVEVLITRTGESVVGKGDVQLDVRKEGLSLGAALERAMKFAVAGAQVDAFRQLELRVLNGGRMHKDGWCEVVICPRFTVDMDLDV